MEARDGSPEEEEEDDDDKIAHCNDDDFLFFSKIQSLTFLGKIFLFCQAEEEGERERGQESQVILINHFYKLLKY